MECVFFAVLCCTASIWNVAAIILDPTGPSRTPCNTCQAPAAFMLVIELTWALSALIPLAALLGARNTPTLSF